MISVYKSDTGQFVLVHQASETVIVDEVLESGFDKMVLFLKEHHPDQISDIRPPYDPKSKAGSDKGSGTISKIALLILVLLPFLWLITLHSTISGVVGELMVRFEKAAVKSDEAEKKKLADVETAISILREEMKQGSGAGASTESNATLMQLSADLLALQEDLKQVHAEITTIKGQPAPQ